MSNYYSLVLLVVFSIGVTACDILTGSNQGPHQLHIENGVYEKTGTNPSGESVYNLEFTYYVENEPCEIGGYGLKYDERRRSVFWYMKQHLNPEKRYTITDILESDSEIETPPVISIQCYLVGSSDSSNLLRDEYELLRQ